MKTLLLTLTITLLGSSAFAQSSAQFDCRWNTNEHGKPIIRVWGNDGANWLKVGEPIVFLNDEERARALPVCQSYAKVYTVRYGEYGPSYTIQNGYAIFYLGEILTAKTSVISTDIYPALQKAAELISQQVKMAL